VADGHFDGWNVDAELQYVRQYAGAVVGLAALGHRTVRLVLLPHLADYLAHLQPLLDVQVTSCDSLRSLNAAAHTCVLDCAA
jgi:TAF6 C-terminal HEAT repeat domain